MGADQSRMVKGCKNPVCQNCNQQLNWIDKHNRGFKVLTAVCCGKYYFYCKKKPAVNFTWILKLWWVLYLGFLYLAFPYSVPITLLVIILLVIRPYIKRITARERIKEILKERKTSKKKNF